MALTDYAGAIGRITLPAAVSLDARRYAVQVKEDGAYVRISTDAAGRVSNVLTRAGEPVRQLADILGIRTGARDAVLHGEATAWTEAGIREAAALGYPVARLFDITRLSGRDVSGAAYEDRYRLLHESRVDAELAGDAIRPGPPTDARGNVHDSAGRFATMPTPRDAHRRLPIVPLHRGPGAVARAWREVELHGLEGLVVIDLRAPLGRRNAKRKLKPAVDLDVTITDVGPGAAMVAWAGKVFAVSAVGKSPAPGEVWKLRADGFTEGALPKFARLQHRRDDLYGTVH